MTRKEIEFQCQLAYDAKLLELIGKNVGDKVKCSFFVHSGDRKHSYTSSIEGEGTIILDEKGYGILSDKEYQDSKEVRDYPWSHSNFRTHWEYETKKIKVIYQIHKIMTREEIKELLPIMQAWAEGKIIQFRKKGTVEWVDLYEDDLRVSSAYYYRIKPESQYRPFKSQEECWNEIMKHQPFGWVKSKDKGYFHLIGLVQWSSEFEDVMITFATSEQLARSSRSLFEDFTFADGAPFGVKEE